MIHISNIDEARLVIDNDANNFDHKLFCARIFKRDLLSEEIVTYAMYSDEPVTLMMWLDHEKQNMQKLSTDYVVCYNYRFDSSYGKPLFSDKII